MPYKVTRRSGAVDTLPNEFPMHVEWAHASTSPWAVVKCQWVEPQTETFWRWTYDDGDSTVRSHPPAGNLWHRSAAAVIKCERIEVEVTE